ncbi:MAG: hypothetical protein ABMA00_11170 [Gemmatimonas sp.]
MTQRQTPIEHAKWANVAPILAMNVGFLSPLLLFWSSVWGPLRPYADVGPLSPTPMPYVILLALSVGTWWLPSLYLRARGWERDGRVYRWLGVRAFRALVPDGDWVNRRRRRRQSDFRVVANRAQASAFLARTEASERGHTMFLWAGIVSAVYAWQIGWHGWALLLAVGNLLVNAYPILLQRYTRGRICRMMGMADRL